MARKVETVKRETKQRTLTHYHVLVGGHPVRTFEDELLAQHFAADEKVRLCRQGCDLSLPEHAVSVEEETKEQDYTETVPV